MSGDDGIYRDHAETYARFADGSAPNSLYDRPAISRLAGDVAGKRVLELGCAGGGLTAQLAGRGADVLALDREPRLVALARQRLGQQAQIEEADLERPLTVVPSGSMDLVVASLVLHYVEHWPPPARRATTLLEARRCACLLNTPSIHRLVPVRQDRLPPHRTC